MYLITRFTLVAKMMMMSICLFRVINEHEKSMQKEKSIEIKVKNYFEPHWKSEAKIKL